MKLCWHKYGEPELFGPFRDLNYGFARTFGNAYIIRKCLKCGKKKIETGYLP